MSNIGTKFIIAQRFIFDPNNNSIIDQHNQDELTRLGTNESRILLMLSKHPNEVISRHQLHEFVWREQGFEVDDSSLTQAMSTLRKVLTDSTKSPQFVKTVPKRGYQLITTVERFPLSPPLPHNNEKIASVAQIQEQRTDAQQEESAMNTTDTPFHNAEQGSINREEDELIQLRAQELLDTKSLKLSRLLNIFTKYRKSLRYSSMAVALFMPFCVNYLTSAPSLTVTPIASFHGITILASQQPSKRRYIATEWLPNIERCITYYKTKNRGSTPEKMIITSDKDDNITLNYIHSIEQSSKNISIKLIAFQTDLKQACQGEQP